MKTGVRLKSVCWTFLAFGVLSGLHLFAASPQLTAIIPPGVERGREHVLTFTGARLEDTAEILFYDKGVTAQKIEVVDAQNVRVTLAVSPDCRLGLHFAQLRTKTGISDFRPFSVGTLPSIDEKEPNNSVDDAQHVQLKTCVSGVLKAEDVDCFRVQARKGQRLSVEVEGIRLGQAMFDTHLTVLDNDRKEIATSDDTTLTRQDSALSLIVPEDGEFTLVLREASYRGADNCRYRLHVGSFPRPVVAYPAGGKRGEKIHVQFLGDAFGVIERPVDIPVEAGASPDLIVEDEHGITPTPVAFRPFVAGNVLEQEPNDGFEAATAAELPLALNGKLEKTGDADFFKFTARKGQVWDIECYARRVNSPCDPVINLYKADKSTLVGNDDSRGQDSHIRWQVNDDGDYYIRVADRLKSGSPKHVYRIEFTPVAASLKVGIPRIDRYSQTRQSIVVPRGNRYGTLILASRTDFSGPIEVLTNNLIPGLSATARPMHPSMNLVPVVFEADEEAPIEGDLVDLRAKRSDDKPPAVEGGFENAADLVLGEPNNNVYVSGTVHKVAMAVTEKVPYRVEIIQPKVPLVRLGTMNLKVVVHRDPGFEGPLTLQFPFTPPGVGAAGEVTVEKNKSEALYPLNANATAAIGKWPVMVIAAADLGGQAWVSSQLAELEIADRFVAVEMKRAACPQADSTQIRCALDVSTTFPGTAKAELLGLPPGATSALVEFTKETQEMTFVVNTTKATPLGNHKNLICQTTIFQDGEPIIANAGTTELRITPPIPQRDSDAAGAAQTSPTSKPMSRLEQLRAKALERQR